MAKKKWSRRHFLKLATGTAAGALATACQTEVVKETVEVPVEKVVKETVIETVVEKETVVETVVVEAAPEPVTISWWNQFSAEYEDGSSRWDKIVQAFEEHYPNVTVDYEISGGPPGGGEFIEALLARIAAGDPPDATTLWTPPLQFGVRGSLMPIDEFMNTARWAKPGTFFEGPLGSCQWRGETYGLPASAGNTAMFYNKELFEAKGIPTAREDFPKTWDDLKALSAEFVEWDGDELKMAGMVPWAMGWGKPIWSSLNGSQLFDHVAEQYTLDSAENIEWWEYMVGWLDEQYKGDIELLNTYGPFGGGAPRTFGQQREVVNEGGSWWIGLTKYDFEFELAEYPIGPSGSVSQTGWWPNWWAVPTGAPHPEWGFRLTEWFATKGWELNVQAGSMDTPAWKDSDLSILPLFVVDNLGLERAQEVVGFFRQYLERAAPMWNSPVEDFASNTLGQAADEILHKTKTSQAALQEAQELSQAKLEEVLAEV